jgi:hypothetical protein
MFSLIQLTFFGFDLEFLLYGGQFFMEVQEQAVQTGMHDSLILSTIALCFSTRGGVENRHLAGV